MWVCVVKERGFPALRGLELCLSRSLSSYMENKKNRTSPELRLELRGVWPPVLEILSMSAPVVQIVPWMSQAPLSLAFLEIRAEHWVENSRGLPSGMQRFVFEGGLGGG